MAASNSFGRYFRVTTFGESHGPALGVVVDGCPAGIELSEDFINQQLQRRRPGSNHLVSARSEPDKVKILSGVYQGKTLGTPIAMVVENLDARSQDYQEIAQRPRPGHVDDIWQIKFGHRDPRGGGRASGRETVSRVMAGAVAELFLRFRMQNSVKVHGFVAGIGPLQMNQEEVSLARMMSREEVDGYLTRCPTERLVRPLGDLLATAKKEGESYGALVELIIRGLPVGLGEPVFHKLKAELASAYLSVGACVGVEFGAGFESATAQGTVFHKTNDESDPYGGLRGGMATGEPVLARVAIKPTSSILDVAKKGRHDPCIGPRALPVLEAMAWLVIADQVMGSNSRHFY